mmetsp:Transcript_10084/g.29815  ORF Transcript_10084/g.29815 Transcript_10084/m.29815 type:complete len:786 (+) Transcript_10084:160-2517(+)
MSDDKDKGKERTRELLDDYRLGDMIGQGAFGVVYLCTKKGGGKEEFAVKMIDKVETPLEEIKEECRMLQKLSHPTIVKLHQVYYEKVFVCMVMDIYKGGDLIEGMQDHWQTKGMIPCKHIPHIAKQMLEPLQWLHSQNCAHRDIKGDNYLMSVRNVVDPQLRLWLSDFGTVAELNKPGDRFKSSVGTKIYWAPEQFQKDYGVKCDVWACGIVTFGLVEGKFPFKGQSDVCRKAVKLPRRAPESGKNFIEMMLTKKEEDRPDAKEALALPWLAKETSFVQAGDDEKDKDFKPDHFDRGGNAGQAERRRLLVERLENSKKAKEQEMKGTILWLPLATFWKPSFEVPMVKGGKQRKVKFEWQTTDQIEKSGNAILNMSNARKATPTDNGSVAGSMEVIDSMLTDHGINTKEFGRATAKTLEEFTEELHKGASRLMLDAEKHKTIVRVVDIVLLRIVHGSGRLAKFMVKKSEHFSDGRIRKEIDQLPGTKKDPHENTLQVAERLLSERLNMTDCKVCLDFSNTEIFEEEDYSPSYPGVRTVYRKEIVQGQVISTDKAVLDRIGLQSTGSMSSEDSKKCVRVYHWMSEAECEAKKIKLRAPKEGSEVSALVQAPVGYNEEALIDLLMENGVDVTKFGEGHSKTLKEFSDELIKGEASISKVNGQLKRIVDVVVLKLAMPKTGSILVEAEEIWEDTRKVLNWLPAAKRRPDENQFLAAQRVIQLHLKMDPNYLVVNSEDVRIVEEEKESFHFPGLKTLYKKRIITATLMRTAEFVSSRHTLGSRGPGLTPS